MGEEKRKEDPGGGRSGGDELRPEYDFRRGRRGVYAGKDVRIIGPVADDESGGGEDGVRRLPEDFTARLEEECAAAAAAAPEPFAEVFSEIVGGTFLDGFTVEEGTHPLPLGALARLSGRELRRAVSGPCRAESCGDCGGSTVGADVVLVCSHFCHEVSEAGGLPS